jgi:HlyD family secretion protein
LNNAKKILERNAQLLKDGIISQADYEQSLTNVENLEANLRSSEANIRSAIQSIKGNEFSIESAEASLKELNTSLSRTTIKAPVDGIVSSLSVEKGERVVGTIQMAGTEMMRIANLNTMEVQVDVSENDIIKVSLGDRVDIEVDAYLDKKVKGVVTEIANSASNLGGAVSLNTDQVTNFIVKIRIDQDSYKDLIHEGMQYPFRPGMSASVDIYTEELEGVVSVPIQCITARELDIDEDDDSDEKEFKEVAFKVSGDTVSMVQVKTGIQDNEHIQILEGIAEGDRIVSGPYSAISGKLKEGDTVYEKEDKDDKKKDKKESVVKVETSN